MINEESFLTSLVDDIAVLVGCCCCCCIKEKDDGLNARR